MQYILRSEDQDTLQKDDFTLMQSYITDLIAYKEVLMQKFPNQNISLFSIEKSYKSRILEDNRVKNALDRIQGRSLDYMIQLCKTPEEFERMCGNNDVRDVLKDSKETNIGLIIHLYKIQTSEEFERMCGSKNLGMFLICSQKNNPDYMIQLCKTPEEFERMCKNKGV